MIIKGGYVNIFLLLLAIWGISLLLKDLIIKRRKK